MGIFKVRADIAGRRVGKLLEFLQLVGRVPGVHVLTSSSFAFPGGGLTGAVVLSESHAAVHTWPERNAAWVELATCSGPDDIAAFEAAVARWRTVSSGWRRTP